MFVCQECGCVENTALSHFWFREMQKDSRALCSECDPEIKGGWHGAFPKEQYDPEKHKSVRMVE